MAFFTKKVSRLVPGRQSRYSHFFGGEASHQGVSPRRGMPAVHLIYDLDLRDPALGLEFPGIRRLPLYNALQYNCCAMTYRVIDENKIEILSMEDDQWNRDHPYDNYPPIFNQVSVEAVPITYRQQKILAFSTLQRLVKARSRQSRKDKAWLKQTGYPFSQIGGVQFLWQGQPQWDCGNRRCQKYGRGLFNEVFAVIWERPVPNVHLWDDAPEDEDTGSVQLIFSRCRKCGVIHSCNRCD